MLWGISNSISFSFAKQKEQLFLETSTTMQQNVQLPCDTLILKLFAVKVKSYLLSLNIDKVL